MAPARLDLVKSVTVRREVVLSTIEVLREFGAQRCEGLVLWAGDVGESAATVTHLIVPDQRPIKDELGVGYFVDGEVLFQLNMKLTERGLRLVAQVHSHPSEAYHSEADDRYAIVTAEGGLSLVVPDFGNAPADPSQWAVYRLEGALWKELAKQDIDALIRIGDD